MLAFALALAVSAAPPSAPPTAVPAQVKDVFALEADQFEAVARRDLKTLRQFISGMQSVFARAQKDKRLFGFAEGRMLKPEEKAQLLSTWGTLFAYFSATEGLRQKYWGFVKLPPTSRRHAWGFLLTHTALTSMLSVGMRFADLSINNKQLETIFDEPNDEYGVPRGAFARFKMTAIHVATATQLMTGDLWARTAGPLMKSARRDEDDVKWAWAQLEKSSKEARGALLKQGVKLFAGNAKDLVMDSTLHAVFPAQKTFAEWMGDTRVARNGKPLITRDVVEKLVLPKLLPGDILVTRQNWFLSNIGLPGFWPHAELYVGTAAELARAMDLDPEVSKWAAAQPEKAATFTQLLEKRYAAKWKAYATGLDFQGHGPIRVIESISEGVSFTAIEHAFGVDYLGAMRPRRSPLEKARAIERAFRYQGRPYDFDFDFYSDATLVCTELVYKAYQPGEGLAGVPFDLVNVAGRKTLPANDIVKRFDADAGKADRSMDFVLFVDGLEHEGAARLNDEAAFRGTWKRLKWDVAQH